MYCCRLLTVEPRHLCSIVRSQNQVNLWRGKIAEITEIISYNEYSGKHSNKGLGIFARREPRLRFCKRKLCS